MPVEFRAYQVMKSDSERLWRFGELAMWAQLTPRVLSNQLTRLLSEGLIIRLRDPSRQDGRVKWTYKVGPGWTYRKTHEAVIAQVARAISQRQVFYPESAGHILAAGAGEPLVYVNMVIAASPGEAESYRPTPSHFKDFRSAVTRIKSRVRKVLDKFPEQWDGLLRELLAQIVTSQDRNFFLIAYPHRTLRTGRWPEPAWKEDRDRTVFIPRSAFPRFHTLEPFPRYGKSSLPILSPGERRLAKRWPCSVRAPPGNTFSNFYEELRADHDRHGHRKAGTCDCFHRVLWERQRRARLPRKRGSPIPVLTASERKWAMTEGLMPRLESEHARKRHLDNGQCDCFLLIRQERAIARLRKEGCIASD